MKARPLLLSALLAGCGLALVLLWWLGHDRAAFWGSHPFVPGRPPPLARVALPRRSSAAPTAAASRNLPANLLAGELLTYLRARLERPDARPNEGVLSFRSAEAYQRFLARAKQAGLTVLGQSDGLLTARVRYDSLAGLQGDILDNAADYESVGGNYLMQFPTVPAKQDRAAVDQVPFGNSLLSFLGATGDRTDWGRGTTIAILDSGVGADATFAPGQVRTYDLGLGTAPGSGADDGHGTAVAALAGGFAPDAPGIAPSAGILSIRVTGADGTSDIFTLAQAIQAAVDSGAQIINISMGGYDTNAVLTRAIDYAAAHGAVIVAAAGNDQAAQLTWPAADPRVISVGAIDALEQQVIFSNSGPQLQMTAPGYGVQTAWLNGQRVLLDGTSVSSPIVAGAIAAVMSQNPGLTATQAWDILRQYSNDGGAPGDDADYGNGVLNVGWAMNHADPTRVDTAISSHYYDPATGEMEFVVQNRGGQTVSGLQLGVDAAGVSSTIPIPPLKAGASYVAKQPVDQATLASAGRIEFHTQLVNPAGTVDQFPTNNRKASVLSKPATGAGN
ncbi:MAG TPA: S8 family serine peptidase [Opitutaceae bacterium]|nr:S8 family serine peptidase [Opitutaceae bacterium]